MKCSHCSTEFQGYSKKTEIANDSDGTWIIESSICPSCKRSIMELVNTFHKPNDRGWTLTEKSRQYIRPKTKRPPAPKEVSEGIAELYREACLVIPDSPRTSAALSRLCIQNILKEYFNINKGYLESRIKEAINQAKFPAEIVMNLNLLLKVSDFKSNPLKSRNCGCIVDVDKSEAEFYLEVLGMIFDDFRNTAHLKEKTLEIEKKFNPLDNSESHLI